MTRMYRTLLAGALLAGLSLTSIGVAQAETIQGEGSGVAFTWKVPSVALPGVEAPELTVTVNGETHTVGGEIVSEGTVVGGTIEVSYLSGAWEAHALQAECDPGQLGSAIALFGTSPDSSLSAVYTPLSGDPIGFSPEPNKGRTPRFSMELCI